MPPTRDPFRAPDDPAITFELRSSVGFIVGLGAIIVLGIVLIGLGVALLVAGRPALLGVAAVAAGVLCPFAMWSSRSTYAVPGGRAQLRILDDRIEIVGPRGTTVVDARELKTQVVGHRVRVLVGVVPLPAVETDRHLTFATSGRRTTLSRRVFASSADFERACAAIGRLAAGDPPQIETPSPPPTASAVDPRDAELQRRLHAELDAMARD